MRRARFLDTGVTRPLNLHVGSAHAAHLLLESDALAGPVSADTTPGGFGHRGRRADRTDPERRSRLGGGQATLWWETALKYMPTSIGPAIKRRVRPGADPSYPQPRSRRTTDARWSSHPDQDRSPGARGSKLLARDLATAPNRAVVDASWKASATEPATNTLECGVRAALTLPQPGRAAGCRRQTPARSSRPPGVRARIGPGHLLPVGECRRAVLRAASEVAPSFGATRAADRS
jgi:hypothetical protein